MKLSHLFLALTLSACALTAQAQTDNVRRHKTTTPAAKPAAKPATKPAAKSVTKPAVNPAAQPVQEPEATPKQETEATPKQETEASSAVVEEDKIYDDTVEQPPTFPGGMSALMQHLATHVKYPKAAQEQKIQGTVILKFVVLEDGSVSDVEVSKSLEPHCDEEAVRVVKELPQFIPGKQQGKPVRVWLTLPIRFRL